MGARPSPQHHHLERHAMYLALTDTFPGEWARGATETEALDRLATRGKGFLVVRISDLYVDPYVDGLGRVFADHGPILSRLIEVEGQSSKLRAEAPVIAEAWRLTRKGGKREHLDPVTLEPFAPVAIVEVTA